MGSIADWKGMKYVFFHCVAGKNRTPAAAVGYFKYVASRDHTRNPPQLVVIEGGFDGVRNTPGSDQCMSTSFCAISPILTFLV